MNGPESPADILEVLTILTMSPGERILRIAWRNTLNQAGRKKTVSGPADVTGVKEHGV